jgi:hypothetical protein
LQPEPQNGEETTNVTAFLYGLVVMVVSSCAFGRALGFESNIFVIQRKGKFVHFITKTAEFIDPLEGVLEVGIEVAIFSLCPKMFTHVRDLPILQYYGHLKEYAPKGPYVR